MAEVSTPSLHAAPQQPAADKPTKGPMPVLGDPAHKDIVASLTQRVPKILKLGTPDAPRAIVVVTAHWSEDKPTISSGEKHPLLYDYGGFPAAAYKLKYDAPGSPEVAEEVSTAFAEAGLNPVKDGKRGELPRILPSLHCSFNRQTCGYQ
jgi:aromatic ring-opening dioxygenase catalytic subunit (LigB family)